MTRAVAHRRQAIASLISSEEIASQDDLARRLADAGLSATQATLSRDLDALGAVKVKRGGQLAYALPDELGTSDWAGERLTTLLGEWVVGGEVTGNLIILRARPGSAHVVGAALDQAQLSEVAGTIAGDDTLFVAVRDGCDPAKVLQMLAR
ncbi:MAG: arginine repressor [Sphingomonadales bacterium]|nr:arginine repressor [Sphingomonadales bacterium]